MVSTVLIANRGEIARRVIRSCRGLGLRSVAVYSEADAALAFVEEADAAVQIGPAAARDSYLNVAAVLAAAGQTNADAVHPGYGFLAENAGFAEAAMAQGLAWIGPRPETIRAMGDKESARRIATRADVPVAPGSRRMDDDALEGLEAEADRVGYPLLVKASAGGGGIGMQRVDSVEKLRKTASATRSMATKSFGDGAIFLERFIPKARHVEVQVFGYGDGAGVHVYERDCSLQRRYQKVIEESPAPGLSAQTRDALATAALSLVRETRYAGAGTVEFIVDAETEAFFFLEMNTRIQVEHPVTEMVAGLDLVAMQIQLAAQTLQPLAQSAIATDGAAVEVRLYAEDPAKKFFPQPGTLETLNWPPASDDLRIEAAYRAGEAVTPFYDPMIAKLIARGPTRAAALQRAEAALRATEIAGVSTNRDFLIACLTHPAFASGDVHTGFIAEHMSDLLAAT